MTSRGIGSVDEFSREMESLKSRATLEVQREVEYQKRLLARDPRIPRTIALVIVSLLVNMYLFFFLPPYRFMFYWIAASFYLVVINPFIYLIPSTEKTVERTTSEEKMGLRDQITLARKAGLRENYVSLGHILWNVFFINCKPLAIGFSLIFSADIVFALITAFQTAILDPFDAILVIYQSMALIVFYTGIIILEPYRSDFFSSIRTINTRIHLMVKRTWQVFIIIAGISALIGVLVITAMILPGFTLGKIVSIHGYDYLQEGIIPIVVIFVTQVVLLRFLQGIHSKMMLLEWSRNKVRTLQSTIIEPPGLAGQLSSGEESVSAETLTRAYAERYRVYLAAGIYSEGYQDLLGILPVFFIFPNFSFILKRETIEGLRYHLGMQSPL
jgi:hypothetical protein